MVVAIGESGTVVPLLRGAAPVPWGGGGICAARYCYGAFTRNALAFTPSQNAPEGQQTIGYNACVNIPPSCPIRRLPE